jgi:membrane protease YdiL (CAAX protease family)
MNYQLLDVDLSFHYEDLRIFIPVVGTLISFIIFWFAWQSEQLKQRLIDQNGQDLGSAKLVIYTKILGGLSMGLIPAIAYLIAFPETRLIDFGWGLPASTLVATLVWTLGLGTLMFFLVRNNAMKPESLLHYPQIRAKKWTPKMVRGSMLGWTAYLVGYEALFRGVLLFPLVEAMGLWPAIAVNIGLYSGTHIPKGLKETLGAIPLSIVLCLLSVSTGNIWIAVIVHLTMAYTNVLVSLKHHPEMEVVKG